MDTSAQAARPPQNFRLAAMGSDSGDTASGGRPQGGPRGDAQGGDANARLRRIPVQDILRGQKEVVIEHGNQEYRLRMTSNSKLILTK